MRTGHTSDLVKCSSLPAEEVFRHSIFPTGHTLASWECFSICALIIFFLAETCPAMTVTGLPDWLSNAAERSLKAVWSEIPNDLMTDREGTLELVASRLFAGYSVKVMPGDDEPAIIFRRNDTSPSPEVRIILPEIRGEALTWFSNDISGLPEEISRTAGEIPQNALTWADNALRDCVGGMIQQRLPGWEFTQQIYISESSTSINLSFRPSSQMILAVKPSLTSRTIPVMLRSDLEAKIQPEMSPLIGLPVKWAERHKNEIEELARSYLEERNTVGNMRASVSVKFTPGKISDIDARVDSRTLMFSVWVAAYAGIDGRYPEAGAFFGFRPSWKIGDVNLAPEVYAEAIFSLDDFGVTYRAGQRFELLENLWSGIEYEMPEGNAFLRTEYIPLKIRRPYGRWRWKIGRAYHELGLGYKFDEHVSVEIYYDGSIGLRGIWNL